MGQDLTQSEPASSSILYGREKVEVLTEERKIAKIKADRERECNSVKPSQLRDRFLSFRQRVCPSCLAKTSDKTCVHIHPEDQELFKIKTIPMEFMLVTVGTANRQYKKAHCSDPKPKD